MESLNRIGMEFLDCEDKSQGCVLLSTLDCYGAKWTRFQLDVISDTSPEYPNWKFHSFSLKMAKTMFKAKLRWRISSKRAKAKNDPSQGSTTKDVLSYKRNEGGGFRSIFPLSPPLPASPHSPSPPSPPLASLRVREVMIRRHRSALPAPAVDNGGWDGRRLDEEDQSGDSGSEAIVRSETVSAMYIYRPMQRWPSSYETRKGGRRSNHRRRHPTTPGLHHILHRHRLHPTPSQYSLPIPDRPDVVYVGGERKYLPALKLLLV